MLCDKCGQEVMLDNDAVALEYMRQHSRLPEGIERFSYGARHLFPVEGCEGSPSRAQYLGGPKDARGYELDEKKIPEFEQAYEKIK